MDERRLERNQRVTKTGRMSVPINISWMTSPLQSRPDKMVTTSKRDREPQKNMAWVLNAKRLQKMRAGKTREEDEGNKRINNLDAF